MLNGSVYSERQLKYIPFGYVYRDTLKHYIKDQRADGEPIYCDHSAFDTLHEVLDTQHEIIEFMKQSVDNNMFIY